MLSHKVFSFNCILTYILGGNEAFIVIILLTTSGPLYNGYYTVNTLTLFAMFATNALHIVDEKCSSITLLQKALFDTLLQFGIGSGIATGFELIPILKVPLNVVAPAFSYLFNIDAQELINTIFWSSGYITSYLLSNMIDINWSNNICSSGGVYRSIISIIVFIVGYFGKSFL